MGTNLNQTTMQAKLNNISDLVILNPKVHIYYNLNLVIMFQTSYQIFFDLLKQQINLFKGIFFFFVTFIFVIQNIGKWIYFFTYSETRKTELYN